MSTNSWFRSPLDILQDGFDIVSGVIDDSVDTLTNTFNEVVDNVMEFSSNATMVDVARYSVYLPVTLVNNVVDHFDTNGYRRVLAHTIADDLIGEGIPAFVGLIGDVAHGTGESLWGGVTAWDWKNPFYRVTRSDSYAAKMGRWGSEYIGQPLSEMVGAGDVHFRQAGEGDEGGVKGFMYTLDGESYQSVDGGVATLKIVGNVADVVVPGTLLMKSRHLRTLSKVGGAMALSSLGEIGWEMIDDGDAARLLDVLNEADGMNSERGIRQLQRRLNEVNKPMINQSIDELEEQKRFVREGKITGDKADVIMGARPDVFLDDDGLLYTEKSDGSINESVPDALEMASGILEYEQRQVIAEKAENANNYLTGIDTVDAHLGVLGLEQKFYSLAEEYIRSPETFDPSQSDVLSMQMWLSGNNSMIVEWGLDGKGEMLEHLDKYLEKEAGYWREDNPVNVPARENGDNQALQSDVNTRGQFNAEADSITIETFLEEKKYQIGTDISVAQQKLDDLYMQKIEVQQQMHVY